MNKKFDKIKFSYKLNQSVIFFEWTDYELEDTELIEIKYRMEDIEGVKY